MSNEKDNKSAADTKAAESKETVAETVEATETAKAEKSTAKAAKTADASAGKTKEYFEEQGDKSKKNRANGGENVTVSLTNKTAVRFKKNYGFFKEGHEQEVSDVALAIYEKAGVVEKL